MPELDSVLFLFSLYHSTVLVVSWCFFLVKSVSLYFTGMGEMCRNGGSCNNDTTTRLYSCSCENGFQGNNCEIGEFVCRSFPRICVGLFVATHYCSSCDYSVGLPQASPIRDLYKYAFHLNDVVIIFVVGVVTGYT